MAMRDKTQPLDVDGLIEATPEAAAVTRDRPDPRPEGNPDIGSVGLGRTAEPDLSIEGIPVVWRTIASLLLRGVTQVQIARELNYSVGGIGHIVDDPRFKGYIDKIIGEMDDEFIRMKPLALGALRNGLMALDSGTALRASEQWFKGAGFGGFGSGGVARPTATAEEVASRLLNQVNVQVNITPPQVNITSGEARGGDTHNGGADSKAPAGDQGQPASPKLLLDPSVD